MEWNEDVRREARERGIAMDEVQVSRHDKAINIGGTILRFRTHMLGRLDRDREILKRGQSFLRYGGKSVGALLLSIAYRTCCVFY